MPVGLALALALLSDEAALVRLGGRNLCIRIPGDPSTGKRLVVRATYVAMVASWTVSSFIGAGRDGNILEFESFKLGNRRNLPSDILSLLALGIWAQWRGREDL